MCGNRNSMKFPDVLQLTKRLLPGKNDNRLELELKRAPLWKRKKSSSKPFMS